MEEIYQTFLVAQQEGTLPIAVQELDLRSPAPMNTMLVKQPRQEAIQKWSARKSIQVVDVPATAPGTLINLPHPSPTHTPLPTHHHASQKPRSEIL